MITKIFHLVYKITNSKTGKYYIGVHSTKNIEDGYMGSGSLLKRDIEKFGIKSFERDILFCFDSREEALCKEKEIVDIVMLKDENCYNLIVGGKSGFITTTEKRELFDSNACETKTTSPELRFDSKLKISFRMIKKPDESVFENLTEYGKILHKGLATPHTLKKITELYNNKLTHDLVEKLLNKLEWFLPFRNNIAVICEPWNRQK